MLERCYQWVFLQGHVLDSGEKRKTRFHKDGETSVLWRTLSLKNTASILYLHRSLGPFKLAMHPIFLLVYRVAT
jgi:hypothetical protein